MTSWSLHKVQSQTNLLMKTVWQNSSVGLVKISSELLSWIGFLYKVVQKIDLQTKFFCPFQELISRTDSRKAPKFGTIAYQHRSLVNQRVTREPAWHHKRQFCRKNHRTSFFFCWMVINGGGDYSVRSLFAWKGCGEGSLRPPVFFFFFLLNFS